MFLYNRRSAAQCLLPSALAAPAAALEGKSGQRRGQQSRKQAAVGCLLNISAEISVSESVILSSLQNLLFLYCAFERHVEYASAVSGVISFHIILDEKKKVKTPKKKKWKKGFFFGCFNFFQESVKKYES